MRCWAAPRKVKVDCRAGLRNTKRKEQSVPPFPTSSARCLLHMCKLCDNAHVCTVLSNEHVRVVRAHGAALSSPRRRRKEPRAVELQRAPRPDVPTPPQRDGAALSMPSPRRRRKEPRAVETRPEDPTPPQREACGGGEGSELSPASDVAAGPVAFGTGRFRDWWLSGLVAFRADQKATGRVRAWSLSGLVAFRDWPGSPPDPSLALRAQPLASPRAQAL